MDEVMQRLYRIAAAAALLALTAAPAFAAAPRPLAERDLRTLVTPLSPAIAPDGKHVALIVRRADFEKNTFRNELVLVDARSGATRTLVRDRDDVEAPAWSPNGDRLAYLATPAKDPDAKDEPSTQLFMLRMDGGEPLRITDAKKGVASFGWRPDGIAFAYIARDESPDAKRIKAHDDWFEVTDNAWTSRAAPVSLHLWTIGADGKKPHRLTQGTWSLTSEPPVYAPTGRSIYAVRTPAASTNHYRAREVVRVDAASGAVRAISGDHADSVDVERGGARLLYSREHPQAFSQSELIVSDLDGRNARRLSARLDRNVHLGLFSNGAVLVAANDRTRMRLFALAADGTPRALPLGEIDPNPDATAARDGTLALVGVTPSHPGELYVLTPGAASARRLTHYNDAIAARPLGRTRTIAWRSADGFEADGVLTEPSGAVRGKTYPLVVLIHGGPTATSREGFSSFPQLLAARGWYVFQPNYRGSDNLGHRWAQATVPYITSSPASDVLDGVDAVLKLGVVDPSRIGVSGWSEGGLLTSWLIGHDHRWRAAVSGAAVNDWTGYADMTDAKDFTPAFIGRSPWTGARERALYDAESPLTYAAAVKTPTLIMSDAGDQRVPTPLSYEFYHAVRATGTPVEMVIVPVNGHFPADPLHREEVNHRWIDWFARHF
jgi:dipeptidyl aminopeptidase/acylaminoacyl peptidase